MLNSLLNFIKNPITITLAVIVLICITCGCIVCSEYQSHAQLAKIEIFISLFGTIASFGMIVITYMSLEQNQKQHKDLLKQWEKEHEIDLLSDIVVIEDKYFLRIRNVGKTTARNITFSMDLSSWNFPDNKWQEYYRQFERTPVTIASGDFKIYYFLPYINNKKKSDTVTVFGQEYSVSDLIIHYHHDHFYDLSIPISVTCGGKSFPEILSLIHAKTYWNKL